MALVRVTVAGTIGKAVRINPDATEGSKIGVDFQLPDGTVPSLAGLADAIYMAAPPAQFFDDESNDPTRNQIYESDIIDGLLLARVADNEVITGAYTFDTNLTMGNGIPINWKDSFGTKFQFLNLSGTPGQGATVGHIISKLTSGVTTTSATYVAVTGASVPFASMEANEDYAVFVRAYIGNSTSITTAQNKCQLTKGGSPIGGSEHIYESPGVAIDSVGMLYYWGGILNSGASGDLQLEHLSGNGSDTVFANNVTIMMIKVADLGLNTNIFHDTDSSLVELDDGDFPPVWFNTGAGVTIGDGTSDYLVFGSIRIQDFLTGGNQVEMRVNDGSTTKSGSEVGREDISDQHTMGFMQLWQAPAASTTLTVEARGSGFPVDKVYASIIAIRMDAFRDYNVATIDPTTDLGNGPTDIVTVAFTTTDTANYGFISGATGPNSGVTGASDFIRNNLNGGGDVTIAGSATQKGIANIVIGSTDQPHWGVSANQALTASDTVDADLHAPDATGPVVWENAFLVAFQWNLEGLGERFNVGDPGFTTNYIGDTHRFFGSDGIDYVEFDIDGTDLNISGFQIADINITGITSIQAGTVDVDFDDITATSYDGILAVNLLDKTAAETISGVYTYTADDGLIITNASPEIHLRETDATADEGNWIIRATNDGLKFQTASDAAPTTGAESFWTCLRTGTVADEVRIKAAILSLRNGASLDLVGTTSTHVVKFSHDNTDLNIVGALTTDINITGITAIQAGTVDLDIDAVTATSYDGILAANLLDKTATEDITGSYTFSVGPTFFSAGTEGAPGQAFDGDDDTGVYSPGANIYAITVGGTEAVRYTGSSAPLIRTGMNSGITASTTQTQGEQPLTASWNEVSVIANNNDVVTLPAMVKGEMCVVINNSTKKLQVFPASGKDCGAGVDTSVTIKGASSRFWFHYDNTVAFDIATDFNNLQNIDTIGASANDLLYFDGTDWKHTGGKLTWDDSLFDITGNLQVSGDVGFYGTAAAAQPTNIADAVTTHALNSTFSDVEVEAALDALGAKFNDLKNNVIEALGLSA